MLKPLTEATGAWKPGLDRHADPLLALSVAWPKIVGVDIAQHSRPLAIETDTLLVATRSSAWTQQLSFLAERVLASIAEHARVQGIKRIRFRVGRLSHATPRRAPGLGLEKGAAAKSRLKRPPAETLEGALESFRTDVAQARRAKAAAGFTDCRRCGIPVPPKCATCQPCTQALWEEKTRKIAQLLYEAPWLGYSGISDLVGYISERDFAAVRRRILSGWWDRLTRAARNGTVSPDKRERFLASSYVLLKSGLEPEHISPAVVRNLLGDEIHNLIFGTVNE
ncbi:MAG: hypothetical protein NVS1B14_02030 [Vulcanimicrobiaceae bacterium]